MPCPSHFTPVNPILCNKILQVKKEGVLLILTFRTCNHSNTTGGVDISNFLYCLGMHVTIRWTRKQQWLGQSMQSRAKKCKIIFKCNE